MYLNENNYERLNEDDNTNLITSQLVETFINVEEIVIFTTHIQANNCYMISINALLSISN